MTGNADKDSKRKVHRTQNRKYNTAIQLKAAPLYANRFISGSSKRANTYLYTDGWMEISVNRYNIETDGPTGGHGWMNRERGRK